MIWPTVNVLIEQPDAKLSEVMTDCAVNAKLALNLWVIDASNKE